MKKIFLLLCLCILITGCTNINDSNIDDILNLTFNTKVNTLSVNRQGYRYYLPRGLSIKSSKKMNEVLTDQKYYYYFYIDTVSYSHKTEFNYNKNNNAYYSKSLEFDDKFGYIEINKYKNNRFLIEIMYNYAKIEVIVDETDINKVVSYAMVVLKSITYNDDVIKNNLNNSEFKSTEEKFNIFEIVGSENYIEFQEDEEIEDGIKDPDYVD